MLQLDTQNEILLDGWRTRLRLAQRAVGTVVYTPDDPAAGAVYTEHRMPHARYATSHAAPDSGAPGVAELERDVLALLLRLGSCAPPGSHDTPPINPTSRYTMTQTMKRELTTEERALAEEYAATWHLFAEYVDPRSMMARSEEQFLAMPYAERFEAAEFSIIENS